MTENRETVSDSAASVTTQVRRNPLNPTIARFVEDDLRAESASSHIAVCLLLEGFHAVWKLMPLSASQLGRHISSWIIIKVIIYSYPSSAIQSVVEK